MTQGKGQSSTVVSHPLSLCSTIEPGQACEFSLQVENYLGARSQTVRRTVQRSTVEESVDVEIIGPQSGTWSPYKVGSRVFVFFLALHPLTYHPEGCGLFPCVRTET